MNFNNFSIFLSLASCLIFGNSHAASLFSKMINSVKTHLYTFERPIACPETNSQEAFLEALKANIDDRFELAGILACPEANAIIKNLNAEDIKLKPSKKISKALKEALEFKLASLRYGNLQVDNDRSFTTCIGNIIPVFPTVVKPEKSYFENDLGTVLKTAVENIQSCKQKMMAVKLSDMMEAIKKKYFSDKNRAPIKGSVLLADLQNILSNTQMSMGIARIAIPFDKSQEALEKLAVRDTIGKILKSDSADFESETKSEAKNEPKSETGSETKNEP